MTQLKLTGITVNDVQVPYSRKHTTNFENVFVYNVDGRNLTNEAKDAIEDKIKDHATRNGFTAIVTFNVRLS